MSDTIESLKAELAAAREELEKARKAAFANARMALDRIEERDAARKELRDAHDRAIVAEHKKILATENHAVAALAAERVANAGLRALALRLSFGGIGGICQTCGGLRAEGHLDVCPHAALSAATPMREGGVEQQIEYMVQRFLGWKLPANFSPDAGISFKPAYNEGTPWPGRHEPTGTNLFDANQATAMVRHMIDGMPSVVAEPHMSAASENHAQNPSSAPPNALRVGGAEGFCGAVIEYDDRTRVATRGFSCSLPAGIHEWHVAHSDEDLTVECFRWRASESGWTAKEAAAYRKGRDEHREISEALRVIQIENVRLRALISKHGAS